jgi:SpoIID/LytB domain protein
MEGCQSVSVELTGSFAGSDGKTYKAGRYQFMTELTLEPSAFDECSFAIDDVTIGVGFHWERKERQIFRGGLRILRRNGLTIINDISLEEYVMSVISSEMSATCPIALLKAHAVISRSWLASPVLSRDSTGLGNASFVRDGEIIRWYGREAHADFDVCADDHCQRYQGITRAFTTAGAEAVRATAHEMLMYDGKVCDARFYKCCGGFTEEYSAAWDDRSIPYLVSVYDGEGLPPAMTHEDWITSNPPAWCNTADAALLSAILPGFDQETRDFYRWKVEFSTDELTELVTSRLGEDLGPIQGMEPLARGRSGRITRLRITGRSKSIIIGKELEIRRVLSRSHLYSSAFVVSRSVGGFVLQGAGWGHGVGLCQIGAAVMADKGRLYRAILQHYYPGTSVSPLRDSR